MSCDRLSYSLNCLTNPIDPQQKETDRPAPFSGRTDAPLGPDPKRFFSSASARPFSPYFSKFKCSNFKAQISFSNIGLGLGCQCVPLLFRGAPETRAICDPRERVSGRRASLPFT